MTRHSSPRTPRSYRTPPTTKRSTSPRKARARSSSHSTSRSTTLSDTPDWLRSAAARIQRSPSRSPQAGGADDTPDWLRSAAARLRRSPSPLRKTPDAIAVMRALNTTPKKSSPKRSSSRRRSSPSHTPSKSSPKRSHAKCTPVLEYERRLKSGATVCVKRNLSETLTRNNARTLLRQVDPTLRLSTEAYEWLSKYADREYRRIRKLKTPYAGDSGTPLALRYKTDNLAQLQSLNASLTTKLSDASVRLRESNRKILRAEHFTARRR